MTNGSITTRPVFATPLAETFLAPCDRLNRDLETLLLQRETDAYRNPMPSHTPQPETFESRFNLFRWPEACVQELRGFMLNSIARVVLESSSLKAEDLARLTFNNHTWFHISRYAGSFVAHNHPLASWSAVYCVRPGQSAPGHADSGVLRFFDTRQGANAYIDPGNAALNRAYSLSPLELCLSAGQLIIFPSYLFHEVAPFYGRDVRITVATNCWFS